YNCFLNSNYCDIYRYKYLYNFLITKFRHVKILHFTDLTDGKYDLNEFIDQEELISVKTKIQLTKQNTSIRNNSIHYAKPTSIKNKISQHLNFINRIKIAKKITGKGYKQRALYIIPNLKLKPKPLTVNFDAFDYSEFNQEYEKIKSQHNKNNAPHITNI
ncbi:hypothetical protein G3N28_19005, partial [Desulfobacter hydrogenophilus]